MALFTPAALAVVFVLILPVTTVAAQDDTTVKHVVMRADHVRHNEASGIITASGSVEFAHEGRILQADTVTYNQPADLIIAAGNVVLVEPTGEILFSEYAEMTGDLREGLIREIRVLLTDNARLAANGARRLEGRTTEMAKAVYSPCELCPETPDRAPLWQVKARSVIHDQLQQDIVYHDATLEVFGFPVLYTPYLRHPDPTVERRTGFLTPLYGSSSTLGHTVRIPYYVVLGPNLRPAHHRKRGRRASGRVQGTRRNRRLRTRRVDHPHRRARQIRCEDRRPGRAMAPSR